MSNDSSLTRADVASWDYDFLVDDFKAWRFVYNGESTPLSQKTAMKDYHSTVVDSTSTMYSATSGYHELEITVPRGRYMLFMGEGYHAYGLIQMHILQETVPVKCDLVGKYIGTDAHTLSFTPPYDYLVDLTVNADSAQKVMDLQYGAETISLKAADPWTLSGSFGEVSLAPFVVTVTDISALDFTADSNLYFKQMWDDVKDQVEPSSKYVLYPSPGDTYPWYFPEVPAEFDGGILYTISWDYTPTEFRFSGPVGHRYLVYATSLQFDIAQHVFPGDGWEYVKELPKKDETRNNGWIIADGPLYKKEINTNEILYVQSPTSDIHHGRGMTFVVIPVNLNQETTAESSTVTEIPQESPIEIYFKNATAPNLQNQIHLTEIRVMNGETLVPFTVTYKYGVVDINDINSDLSTITSKLQDNSTGWIRWNTTTTTSFVKYLTIEPTGPYTSIKVFPGRITYCQTMQLKLVNTGKTVEVPAIKDDPTHAFYNEADLNYQVVPWDSDITSTDTAGFYQYAKLSETTAADSTDIEINIYQLNESSGDGATKYGYVNALYLYDTSNGYSTNGSRVDYDIVYHTTGSDVHGTGPNGSTIQLLKDNEYGFYSFNEVAGTKILSLRPRAVFSSMYIGFLRGFYAFDVRVEVVRVSSGVVIDSWSTSGLSGMTVNDIEGSITSEQTFSFGDDVIAIDTWTLEDVFTNTSNSAATVFNIKPEILALTSEPTSIPLNTMNRFTLVARAATDNIEVYHDGLPAIVTKLSGTTTVADNSFTLGADPTAQDVTLVIGGDENGELLVESCEVVQSAQIITSFADPTYVAEKQWTLTYTQPIALNNVTPADTVLGWGKFDNYLKSDGTKLETGIEVEMWKDYFQVPIENIWGTGTWMIIKTIDGKYYGVGFNQYGQMGMPHQDMPSMTDAANVAESYYFKVPVELPHFAGYDIKKMLLRRNSTMFLTTDGKLYGMGKGEATNYCHFGTGTNGTQLNTITHLATDKVINDFHQSGATCIILTTDNKLFTVGNNAEHGALGNGNTTRTNTFGEVATNITSTETIKQVYTTDGHSASGFFTESGRAFACGWGYQNQYHNGQTHPATNVSFVELKFPDGRKIKQFFMTPIRTWMVDESNDIYVGGAHYENTNGWPSGVFGPGGKTNGPTLIDASINDGSDVIDILQMSTTGIVVVRAGGVYSFGKNDEGRLGNGDKVTTTTTTRAYKIADQHPVIAFITTGLGPYLLIGYRTMAAIAPTLTDMDKITDVNTIGMGRGVTQDVLMGPAHLSDESTSNTSNSGRITSGEVFDFFKMVNDNVDGGPMIGNLSNGDKVYFTGHVSAGAQLFEPYNTTGGNGLISQGRYTGQDLFGYTMPNVGHRYSGAVMYELGSSSRTKQMLMTGFKYRISHVWGNGFRGDIYVFYRKKDSGYDNFKFHEKVEHPSAIGNRATTEDLMFANPTPAANAFLLVFVSNIGGNWQELLRLQLFFNEPPPVIEYPKLPPFVHIDDAIVTEGSIEVIGGVYSEHANITKVYVVVFNEDFWSSDLSLSTIIEMIEGTGAPSNTKAIFTGPYDRYTPTNIEATLTHATDGVGSSALISSEKEVFTCLIVFDDNGKVNMDMFTQIPAILTLNDRDIPPADILDKLIVSYSGSQFYGWGDFVNGTTSAYYGVVGIFNDSLTGVLTAGEGNAPSTFIIDLSWGTGKTYYVKEIGVSRGTNSGRYNTQLTISNEDDTNSVTHTLPAPQYPEVHEIYPVDKRYGIVKIRIHGSNIGNYHYLTKIALYSGV
jgi:alpha-tubulin suppressor-like RCC1 family protein